ncbi:hypothetical protein GP486_007410, partial [Trichoglossum hirsutum]
SLISPSGRCRDKMMAARAYPSSPPSVLSRAEAAQERRRAAKDNRPDDGSLTGPSPPSVALHISKPVVIPSRTSSWKGAREIEKVGVRRSSRRPPRSSPEIHEPGAVPPAVAALLAVTSIPLPKGSTEAQRRRRAADRQAASRLSSQGQFQGHDGPRFISSNAKSPMEILLSPPDEMDEMDSDTAGDSANEAVMCVRSKSSDSVPSLEADTESSTPWSSPPTPRHSNRRAAGDRREKQMSSPPAEDCVLDHPLLNPNSSDAEAFTLDSSDTANSMLLTDASDNASRPERRKISLKSNLTASLRVLRSAARSFSNFSAPFIQPDDFLTRSILSITPLYTDEKRPLPLQDTPTPALRRYLNPISSASADMYSHGGMNKSSMDRCTASIQLQTYRVSRPSKGASSSPMASRRSAQQRGVDDPFAQPSSSAGPIPRQREVRENSDFLRVIVLEMNMRREGKLSDRIQGRAKFVLPPRQPCNRYVLEDGVVPLRWTPIMYED